MHRSKAVNITLSGLQTEVLFHIHVGLGVASYKRVRGIDIPLECMF